MKKAIALIVIVAVLFGTYYYVKNYVRAPFTLLEGKRAQVRRGDLIMPITASGHIRPTSVTNIKSKASGEVNLLPFDIGQYVRKNNLVVRLDKTDESRNVERAKADFERAKVAAEQAVLRHKQAQDVGVELAQAKLDQVTAQQTLARIDLDRVTGIHAGGSDLMSSNRELDIVKAQHEQAKAATKAAAAELAQARIAVDMAEKDIRIAVESRNAAERVLEEAELRLDETEVLSPIDGMVVARHVQIGELVMSGKTSFTGGTVLLEIADVSELFAEVNVDEADIGLVRTLAPEQALPGSSSQPASSPATTQMATLPDGTIETGQPVEITVEAYPDDKFQGFIDRISPQSEVLRAIATFKVWIRLTSDNSEKLKRVLNTQAQANFTAKSVRNALLVQYEAMKPDPNGSGYGVYVPYLPEGATREEAKFVPCKFGVDNRIDVEVIEGLSEGQWVYTKLPIKTEQEREKEEQKKSKSD